MAGVIFLGILANALIFSAIFWLLTFFAKATFSNKYSNYKLNFYECGFKNITKKKIAYEINYIMVILFLLIYDGEFLVLIPFCLSTQVKTLGVMCCLLLFTLWLVIALLFDYSLNALEWQV